MYAPDPLLQTSCCVRPHRLVSPNASPLQSASPSTTRVHRKVPSQEGSNAVFSGTLSTPLNMPPDNPKPSCRHATKAAFCAPIKRKQLEAAKKRLTKLHCKLFSANRRLADAPPLIRVQDSYAKSDNIFVMYVYLCNVCNSAYLQFVKNSGYW